MLINELLKVIVENYSNPILKKYSIQTNSQSVNELVKLKIFQVVNCDLPADIKDLIVNIKNAYDHFEVIEENHLPFPSFTISIELNSRIVEYLTLISSLRIKISLVHPCFTVFFEEAAFFRNISRYRPITFRIVSSNHKAFDPEKDHFNTALTLIKQSLPTYEYIDHKFLLSSKPSDYAYQEVKIIDREDHTLYRYLFDDLYEAGNLEVAS